MSSDSRVYIHGYSQDEQDRLLWQAEKMEFQVYKDIDFSTIGSLLEVGCGVGAQTQILLRRFPHLKVSCIDINDNQLGVAKENLQNTAYAKGRFDIQKMNAEKMTFPDDTFEGAFLCWVLEHMPNPGRVLHEIRRVLKPHSKIVVTEVMNFSVFLDPYCPNFWKFWLALNDYQYDKGGDPFIGVKLGNFLRDAGFTDVRTSIKLLYADKREPEMREQFLLDRQGVALSAAEVLLKEKLVTPDVVEGMRKEFKEILKNPNAITFESFMQATARVP